MDAQMTALYHQVVRGLQVSEALEKHAAAHDDAEALTLKAAQDLTLLQLVKQASALDTLKALGSKVMEHPIGRGAAYGAGAAVPAALAGNYLISRSGEEARETASDIRNKALQTALGLGGVGAGLMAVHRLTQPPDKTASLDHEALLEKLATVGFLEALFEDQATHGTSEEVRKQASECRMLNAEHGIDLLKQLLA